MIWIWIILALSVGFLAGGVTQAIRDDRAHRRERARLAQILASEPSRNSSKATVRSPAQRPVIRDANIQSAVYTSDRKKS